MSPPQPPLVVSIDSSTTACKAIAWDPTGRTVAEGRASFPLRQPQPTWHEQDADEWWAGLCKAVGDCVAQVDARRVAAFAVTHQRETFVALDKDHRPVRPAITWSDERSRVQVAWLERTFGGDDLHRLTGKPPSMTQSLPKIVWLLQNERANAARAAHYVDVGGFVTQRLTGHYGTSLASADPMGLVNMQARAWATDLMADLGLRVNQFSQLYEPGSVVGHVSAAAAAATGLPAGLPVIAAAGDGQCAGLGANSVAPERGYLNIGTAVASGAISDDYLCDRAFRTLYAPIPGKYFIEHVLRGGVSTITWFIDKFAADLRNPLLDRSPEQIMEAAAAKVPPGAAGLMLVPYWNNVMNPYWDPQASGITMGWTFAHGREHLYRAILEGIAFEQRLVGDAMMAAAGRRFNEYITMGGGSRSPLWCQMMADVTGVPVVRSASAEATCLGAGILAAVGAGWYPSVPEAAAAMTATTDRFDPQPETQAIYDRLFTEVYRPLFPALQALADRLTELTHGSSLEV